MSGRGRIGRTAPWLGWSAWLLAAASLALVLTLFVMRDEALSAADRVGGSLGSLPSLAFVTVGAVVISRRPGNVIGWLCYAIGLAQILAGFGGPSAHSVLADDPDLGPGWVVLYELGELCWELSWALLAMLLLLFPTGRLPSRRWRPAAWAAGAVLVLAALSGPFLPGPPGPGLPPNPIAIPPLAGLLKLAYDAAIPVLFGVVLAALVSLVVRFRRATGTERQQLKWFAYGTALLLLLPLAGFVGAELAGRPAGDLISAAIVSALPVAIGIAVLRYRLYDIDRLVNRTVVYGSLTVLLAGVYAGLVFALSQLLNPADKQSALAVAASTLVVAALFQPARRRIQGLVDRRFNRRRYDAARTVAAFSARLRDQIELDTLSTELLAVVDETVQPVQVSLWLRPTPSPGGRPGRR
jgi:uncharacterized membrane protein YhaH (DUF805 family)